MHKIISEYIVVILINIEGILVKGESTDKAPNLDSLHLSASIAHPGSIILRQLEESFSTLLFNEISVVLLCTLKQISNRLPLIAVGTNPDRDFGFFHVMQLSLQLTYGLSMVLLRCQFVPEIMHEIELDVFLYE
jgi:hypothetical protein